MIIEAGTLAVVQEAVSAVSPTALLIAACFAAAALLYSSVGHAGASGYLAVMGLFGVAPAVMKPTALTLNILVASIATARFYRAGHFSWRLFWPFAVTSVPAAYLGGRIVLRTGVYHAAVGVLLLYAAWRMFSAARSRAPQDRTASPPIPAALLAGLGIGLLSGLIGVGGGIFLSPLVLLLGWATMRESAGVAAPFILLNSIAGLLGTLSGAYAFPTTLAVWIPAAVLGGWVGAEYGSRRLATPTLRRLLALVLFTAGLKLILA